MYSELKKVLNVCIVLLLISGVFTILSCILLCDSSSFADFVPLCIICGYLIVSVPVLLITMIVFLKKIIEILRIMDTNLSESIKEVKKSSK